MTVFGFNTDVKVGSTVFHIQTEDRGAGNPVLDTTVYVKGRVLAKRGTSYQDFLESPDFSESGLRAMLERQHRQLVEEVRAGTLAELAGMEILAAAGGISVQLLNPATFLKGTTAVLEVAVTSRSSKAPLPKAAVRVLLHTGTPQPFQFETQSDSAGKAVLQFALPQLGPGGAELVIQAAAADGQDEIKYTLRPKPKAVP